MNILKIKELQKILNTNIKNINNKIIIRDRKIKFEEILYGSIYKCINNLSYQDVSSKINLNFIKQNINTTISKTAFIDKRNNISNDREATLLLRFILFHARSRAGAACAASCSEQVCKTMHLIHAAHRLHRGV